VDLIPRKPLNYLRIADAVLQLEREADRKGLPNSPLETQKGQSLADIADSLYQMAMPRLVAKDVVFPSAEGRLAEARARVALGDKVYPGFPEGMAVV